jgi:ABC-type multidrug transport system fused ATPase/permease subunit
LLAIHGHITTGAVVAFVAGLPSLLTPIQMFAQISDQYFLGQEAYRSVRELLDAPYVEGWHGTRRLAQLRGALVFERVSFGYPGTERGAVRDFTLEVRAGEKIALVGPSGSGKSTLVNLLLGLYAPDNGVIRIDDVPQRDLDMRWFRQQAALVMQENHLLSGTIAENLRFGRADATDAEVIEAAELAQAMEFIRKMPEGLATRVGERGATLSGGQRQRLAIARAILRNPALLILDEPTSALDYESERLIQVALDGMSAGRTVITIAHRLSTIRDADRIIVLREGQIVEIGDYATLVAKKGLFHQMVAAGSTDGIG